MSKVIVLLTALPFTKGHQYLISWAAMYAESIGANTNIIIGTQPHEPMPYEREAAVSHYAANFNNVSTYHMHEAVQQHPKDENDHDFWNMWVDNLWKYLGPIDKNDVIVSSEEYGAKLAAYAECQSIICDPYRDTVICKATDIRRHPWTYWYLVAEEMKMMIRPRITLIGAESVGKTTLARELRRKYGHLFIHEWARPYLETLPSPETTDERMEVIVQGQYSAQFAGQVARGDHLAIIQDTDLLATIGYYRLYCKNYENLLGYQKCVEYFNDTKSDLYFLCSTLGMPFEKDPLRYGGDKRESFDEFWAKLLIEFDCNYRVLSTSNPHDRVRVVNDAAMQLFDSCPIWHYERE